MVKVKITIYVQFSAIQKHQTWEGIFHSPTYFLHPCWELNLCMICHSFTHCAIETLQGKLPSCRVAVAESS